MNDGDPRHGTRNFYNQGCRCDECRATVRDYLANFRREKVALGGTVNGRFVVPPAPHGKSSGYGSWGCRCELCSEFHRATMRSNTQKQHRLNRLAERVSVDGVLIHPNAQHGTGTGNKYYGCQCEACFGASAERSRLRWLATKAARDGTAP